MSGEIDTYHNRLATASKMIKTKFTTLGCILTASISLNAEPDTTISGKTYNSGSVDNEWAQYTLQTGGTVTVKDGADVKFSAGNQITLYPGFSVQPGGVFKATVSTSPSYDPGSYYNGTTPTLVIISGDQQYGIISHFNPAPFDIAVFNSSETNPMANAPVLLTVSIGGGWLAATNDTNAVLSKSLKLTTDSDGTVTAYYKHGPTADVTSYIRAVAGPATLQIESYSTSLDTDAPTTPSNLKATAHTLTGFTLSWDASTDNVGVTGYDVFQDGVMVVSTGATTLNHAFTGLAAATTFSFTVKAKDEQGNISAPSSPLVVVMPNYTVTLDDDGDGIPSVYELNLGLNPFVADGAADDLDGDLVDNVTEYLQGRSLTTGAVADSAGAVALRVFSPAP
jgi:hypothetical protein